jgi:hypothetical protein
MLSIAIGMASVLVSWFAAGSAPAMLATWPTVLAVRVFRLGDSLVGAEVVALFAIQVLFWGALTFAFITSVMVLRQKWTANG